MKESAKLGGHIIESNYFVAAGVQEKFHDPDALAAPIMEWQTDRDYEYFDGLGEEKQDGGN